MEVVAVAGPEVLRQLDGHQVGVEGQLPHREVNDGVALEEENLEVLEGLKGGIVDEVDLVTLEVQLPEVGEGGELKALQTLDVVVLEVEGGQGLEAVEGVVLNLLNV